MFIAYALALLTSLGWGAYALRWYVRERLSQRDATDSDDRQWYEIIQESGKKAGPYTASSFDGMRAISQLLNGDISVMPTKALPRVSFVWVRSADDKAQLTRLYVSASESLGEAGLSALRAYARSIGARLGTPTALRLPADNVIVGRRRHIALGQMRDKVEEIGVVSDTIASIANAVARDESVAVMITVEGMGGSERSMLHDAVVAGASRGAGRRSNLARDSTSEARQMVEGSVRLGLAAANHNGDEQTCRTLVDAVASATSTLGYEVQAVSPRDAQLRSSVQWGVPVALMSVLMMLTGAVGPALLAIALLGGGAAALVWWPEAVDGPVTRMAARGEVLLPRFLPRPMSLRRGFERARLQIATRRFNNTQDEEDVDVSTPFPSPSEVLSVHHAALFEMTTFPAEATLTASDRVQSRGLPPDMVDVEEGIFVGMSGTGQPVLLDIEDIHYTLYTAGAPNSGKSNLLLVMYAGMVKASIQHTSGLSVSPIWGETKGEGAYDAWMIARNHPGAIFVDTHNPRSGARLALEGPRLSDGAPVPKVVSNCTALVSSMQAAYGDGVKGQAREILDNVLRCSMLMTPDEIVFAGLGDLVNAQKPNIMELSFYLLQGDSRIDASAKMIKLGGTLSASLGLREQALSRAIGSMSRFWDPTTRRTYLERISTALNKLNDMRNAPMLWTPDARRKDVYLGQLVRAFAPSVVNMGSFYDPITKQFDQSVDRSVSQRLIRSFNYLLWDYIKGHCNGWQEQRKRIPMFFDEVADVASNATGDDVPNTLEEGTKEGRSRGAAYFLGSQYPSQMPEMVRHQVLGSRGKFWFGLQNPTDLTLAISDLMVDDVNADGAITPSNIKSLSNGVCFATLPRNNAVTPPTLLRVPYAPVWSKILFAPENGDTNDAVADYAEFTARKVAS